MNAKLLTSVIFLALVASPAWASGRGVSLVRAAGVADAVVLATLQDPDSQQTVQPNSGDPPFVRVQWRFVLNRVLKGKTLKAGASVLVDEPAWRLDLAARRACKDGTPCAMPDKVRLDTTLTRPPAPGRQVLVLLRKTSDGWALAFEAGMDAAERAVLLGAKGGHR